MNHRIWPAFVRGVWWYWEPLPGLDPGIREAAYWLGAAKWAASMANGKPENLAHQDAERAVFEHVYEVSYLDRR